MPKRSTFDHFFYRPRSTNFFGQKGGRMVILIKRVLNFPNGSMIN